MLIEFGSLLALLTFITFLASSIWYCVEQFRDGYHVRSIILGLFTIVLSGVPCAPFGHGNMALDRLGFAFIIFAVWWCFIADYMRRLDHRKLMTIGFAIAGALFLVCLVFFFIAFDMQHDLITFAVIR